MSARSLKIASLTAALLLAAAAASAEPAPDGPRVPPGGPEGEGVPQGPGGPGGGIFISPAGEPFRMVGPPRTAGPGGPGSEGPPPEPVFVGLDPPRRPGLRFGPRNGAGGPMAGLIRQWFDGADLDRNGVLNRGEFVADGQRFFAQLDGDGDGRLSDPEIIAYETRVAPEILRRIPEPGEGVGLSEGRRRSRERGPGVGEGQAGGPPPRGRGGPPGGGPPGGPGGNRPYSPAASGAAPFGLLGDPQPLRSADTDFDMRVSGPEWIAAMTRRFARLDRNGDGGLTLEELPVPAGAVGGPGRGRPIRR